MLFHVAQEQKIQFGDTNVPVATFVATLVFTLNTSDLDHNNTGSLI